MPKRPNFVLAATSNGLLYQSVDGGTSWANRFFPPEFAGVLHALEIDRFAGSSYALLKSENRAMADVYKTDDGARVNNCAKRLLLEQPTPMLRDDPNATLVLIGNRDERERGAAASKLDRMRTPNAAAVLSAGTGICPQLELSRVKANWVGSDQSSTPRPLLCGSSTDIEERRGQAVKAADQWAQFRRVDVWIVPGGAAMPSNITGLKELPVPEVRRLVCPR